MSEDTHEIVQEVDGVELLPKLPEGWRWAHVSVPVSDLGPKFYDGKSLPLMDAAKCRAVMAAYVEADRERRKLRALLLAAGVAESIRNPCADEWDGDDPGHWTVEAACGRYTGRTLEEALAQLWDASIRSRDADGNATEESPFVLV